MTELEKCMLAESLQKRGKGALLHDLLNWCKKNQVYRLSASGWVIGLRNECVSLSFEELYSHFENDSKLVN